MIRMICTLLFCLLSLNGYAWNAQGHEVIAQIAFDNLTPQAKTMCQKYLHSRSNKSLDTNFLKASTWLDKLRHKKIHGYDALHYVDISFSDDGTRLLPLDKINAVWGVRHAMAVLSSKNTKASDKAFALRVLIHVVGDIHQPLHAATKISAQYPNGDLGGNLLLLGKNKIAGNLHSYWDRGAGYFVGSSRAYQVKIKAKQLEKKWSCTVVNTEINPEQWAKASNELAINHAYKITPKSVPTRQYRANSQLIVQKQTLLAGCRLAALLNQISKNNY